MWNVPEQYPLPELWVHRREAILLIRLAWPTIPPLYKAIHTLELDTKDTLLILQPMDLPVPGCRPSIWLYITATAVGAAHEEGKEYLVEDYNSFDVGPLGIAL